MATRRFSYKDDWVLKDGNIGINSETPAAKLDVGTGTIKAENIKGSGITTLTTYSGYLNKNTGYLDNVTINSGDSSTLSGEVVIGTGLTMTIGTGATTGQGSIDSLKVSNTFTPPIGGTDERPSAPKPGALFYNKDFKTIEYWDGNYWRQVDNITASGRGLFAGGYGPYLSGSNYGAKNIEYINIATQGNSRSFGDLVDGQGLMDATSSSTRMITSGGYNSSFGAGAVQDIQYVTMASEGNAIDFGDQTQNTYGTGACSSSTRALIMGGNRMPNSSPYDDGNDGNNTICYIEIATIGNALDFGDMSQRRAYPGSCGSSVRAVIFGGYANEIGAGGIRSMETVNYGSKGNGIDFGDLVEAGSGHAKSNSVKGIMAGTSGGSGTYTSVIQSVSIQSLGNAVYFGDRIAGEGNGNACSSQTRAVFAGGRTLAAPTTGHDRIDYVEFASEGNSISFGDLTYLAAEAGGASDCHGGLGGF